jgi:hypothetical protein
MPSAPLVPRVAKLVVALAALATCAAVLLGAVVGGEDEAAQRASHSPVGQARAAGKPVVLAFAGDVHFESTIGAELRSSPTLSSPRSHRSSSRRTSPSSISKPP